jgi:hypothetical protein
MRNVEDYLDGAGIVWGGNCTQNLGKETVKRSLGEI